MAQKAKRKILQLGKYSKVIVIPRDFLRDLKWKENQMLKPALDKKNKRIIVKDAK